MPLETKSLHYVKLLDKDHLPRTIYRSIIVTKYALFVCLCEPPRCNFRVSVFAWLIFQARIGVTLYVSSRRRVTRTLHDLYILHFSPEVMAKFTRKGRGHLSDAYWNHHASNSVHFWTSYSPKDIALMFTSHTSADDLMFLNSNKRGSRYSWIKFFTSPP